jgi:nucleoside-diphosphate-sugar epimerase
MDVLLTGANSFLGRHITAHLLASGVKVIGTYRSCDERVDLLKSLSGDLDLVRISLEQEGEFAVLPKRIDAVVHVAGSSMAPNVSPDDMLASNVNGTRNLLCYARSAGAARIVYASTLSIHGRIVGPVVDENTPVIDSDIYGASKYLGERLFAAAADQLPCVAIRLPGILGLGAHRAWIPTLVERMRRNEDVVIYNPDSSFNNAAHVDDLSDFVFQLLSRHWEGFHALPVGAAGTITVREAVNRLLMATGSQSRIIVHPAQQPGFTISSALAIANFGYRPMEIAALLDRYVSEA